MRKYVHIAFWLAVILVAIELAVLHAAHAQQQNFGIVGPAGVAKADATVQAANIGATTLYSVPGNGAGSYLVLAYPVVTQAATTSSTLPFVQIVYTDNDTGLSNTGTVTNTNTANTVGAFGSPFSGGGAVSVIQVKASTTIQYQTASYASSGVTPMQYAVHIKLEYLGN